MHVFELARPMMGVVELTDDGDILHVRDNIATCEFFGLGPGGTRYRLASAMGVTRDALRQWTGHYRKSAASDEPEQFEFTKVVGDEVRSWFVVVRPLATPPGERQRFMYVAEGGVDHKPGDRAEAQFETRLLALKREYEERESMLSGRIRELMDEASAVAHEKDEFIATLARELRDPLAPVLNAMQLLRAKGFPDPELEWVRDVIHRQVRHMVWVLEDLLDASRIRRGKLELRKERAGIAPVIELAIETSRPFLDAGEHELVVTLPEDPVQVEVDPVRLAQIVSNLLSNAAKFTPKGGRIDLLVQIVPPNVVLRVLDTGIGISKEALPKIFDLFAPASPRKEGAQGGLGIGLSLVRGLVELHGGTVTARSEGLGKGSEFVVTIPISGSTTSDGAAAIEAGTLRHRVLVVDDNRDGADTLAALLEMIGCEVKVAYGGQEALAVAEAFRPAIMLLDIGMPGTDGLAVAKKLRETSWGRDIFLVAVTAWGEDDDRQRTDAVGFDQHLLKPVDIAVLHPLLDGLRPSRHGNKA